MEQNMEVCSGAVGIRKGSWTREEDMLLKDCIEKYGQGKWHLVPSRAGLNRCRKSCRLRWMNYLKPDIKRGEFSADEVDLILRLHKLLGNRWSLIAGRIPGRTANDVKNYWNTHLRKKVSFQEKIKLYFTERPDQKPKFNVIKPRPRTFKNKFSFIKSDNPSPIENDRSSNAPVVLVDDEETGNNWWERLLDDDEETHVDALVPSFEGVDNTQSSLLVKDDNKNLWTDFLTDLEFWDPSV